MQRLPRRRKTAFRSSLVLEQISAYTLAASAAGVGILALAPPAEAKVVHQQLGVSLTGISNYSFNPAHQAAAPFSFSGSFINRTNTWWNRVWLHPRTQYAGGELAQNGFVAKLPAGAVIGQGGAFGGGASLGLLFTYGPYGGGTIQNHKGNFAFGQ